MQKYRKRRWLGVAAAASALAALTAPAFAGTGDKSPIGETVADSHAVRLVPEVTPGSDRPASKTGTSRLTDPVESCTAPDENGRGACIEYNPISDLPALPGSETNQLLAGVAPPQWCENAQNRLLATRTQACRIDGVIYRTFMERNGTRTQTGGVDIIIIINYSYGNTSESRIAHQVDVTAPKGWGDVLKGSYTGNARDGYACKKESVDEGEIPVHSADWSNGLIAPMLQGGALVRTGIRTGSVRVCVQAQQEPATELDTSRPWEEVVEASVVAPRDHLQLESLDFGPPDPNRPLTGRGSTHYRVRVHARGRETAWDKTSETPTEEYLLLVWPSDPAPTQTLRTSNRLEQQQQSETDNPHPPNTTPPEPPASEPRARPDGGV
ncbi:hypothetical protein [Streptomyces africanus]|uniref:hypothetical protein n=1 Tax=Streptomyces africanus TaxID=231024 RepID=UPI00117E3D5C|nr:hypothetical protein [Streptomyces africanus]